jgi:MFS family permease
MPRPGSASLHDYARLIRGNRNFRLLWTAQMISEIGDWFYVVAIYTLLLEYTGTARSIAIAFLLQVLPQTLISPTAGLINDRLSRRRVMMFADWSRALIVLCMLLVRGPSFTFLLYALLLLETFAWALFEPGRSAVVPNIVPPDQMLVANGLSSATWSFNLAVGSAIGGVVAAWLGRDAVFVINSVSFVASALLIRAMRFSEPHAERAGEFRLAHLLDFSPIVAGFRYVAQDRRRAIILFAKCGLGLTMGANWVLIPIFGERVFRIHVPGMALAAAGMLGMSLLMGCRGVGALLAPFVSSPLAGMSERRLRWGILAGYLCGALGYAWLAVAPDIWQACAAIVFAHLGASTVWIFSTTLLQVYTEDRFRGRVFSTEFAFAMLSASVMNFTAGCLIDAGMGVRQVSLLTAALVLIPITAWTLAMRQFRGAPDAREALGG